MSFKSLIALLLQTARNQVYRLDDLAIKQGTKFADTTLNTFENKIYGITGDPKKVFLFSKSFNFTSLFNSFYDYLIFYIKLFFN